MSGSALLRPFRPGDEEAVNDGFNRVFGHRRPLAEWHWKFPPGASLALGRPIFVAVDKERVVAHFAALPVPLRIDGREVTAGQVVDVYSERRPGVFVRLVHRFYDELCGPEAGDIALVYGFPGERHFQLGVKKLRYSEPLPVAFWSRGPAAPRSRRFWLQRFLPARLGGWRVRQGFDPEAADRLWRRSAHRYPVAAVRDAAWLRRRFTGRPGVEYLHLRVERRGEPAALAVLRLPGSGAEEGPRRGLAWAELVWDGRRGALEALDAEVARLAREAGAEASRLWLANDPRAEAILERRGWQRREHPQRLCLGAVSFDPAIDADDLCRRLYLTLGDGDLV
jgi:hypothetical protein